MRGSLHIGLGVRLILLAMLAGLFSLPASAQTKKDEAELRTVQGSVVDSHESPAPSSVVYLVNVKTQAVRTYIADETGRYRFSGRDPNGDYDLHAEHDDSASPTRTVSSFDSRREIEVVLKLSRK